MMRFFQTYQQATLSPTPLPLVLEGLITLARKRERVRDFSHCPVLNTGVVEGCHADQGNKYMSTAPQHLDKLEANHNAHKRFNWQYDLTKLLKLLKSKLLKTKPLKTLLFILLCIPALSQAEITPKGSGFDTRVRLIDYNPKDVVRIATYYGVSTHVQFGEDETIKDVAIGDDQAWNIVPRTNHMFIKPKAKNADTNVTVITNKRVYHFALVVAQHSAKDTNAWHDPNLVYGLTFRYPEEVTDKLVDKLLAEKRTEEAEMREEAQKEAVRTHVDLVKVRLDAATKKDKVTLAGSATAAIGAGSALSNGNAAGGNAKGGNATGAGPDAARGNAESTIKPIVASDYLREIIQQNTNYWAAGSREISPTAARDDGRFTYLSFSNNRDMPAVYSVDTEGNEALINTNVEGNTIIIHRVVPLLRLRKGNAIVCVENQSFNWDSGTDNESGTIAPNVQRITRDPVEGK